MRIAQTVLRDLSTEQSLCRQGVYTLAVLALLEKYHSVVAGDASAPMITEHSVVRELLEALYLLPQSDLLPILHTYLQTVEALFEKKPVPLAVLSPHQPPGAPAPAKVTRLMDPRTKSDFAALDAVEDKKLRRWMIKVGFISVVSLVGMIGGAAVVIGVRSGVMPDGVVVNSLMTTATEMLKLIFSM